MNFRWRVSKELRWLMSPGLNLCFKVKTKTTTNTFISLQNYNRERRRKEDISPPHSSRGCQAVDQKKEHCLWCNYTNHFKMRCLLNFSDRLHHGVTYYYADICTRIPDVKTRINKWTLDEARKYCMKTERTLSQKKVKTWGGGRTPISKRTGLPVGNFEKNP